MKAGAPLTLPGDRLFSRPAIGAMALSAVVLIMIVASSGWVAIVTRHRLDRVVQAEQTQSRISLIYALLENAETGQRGYLLTGRNLYLNPYTNAIGRLPDQLAGLLGDLAGVPESAELLHRLQGVVDDKLAELAETIRLFRNGDEAGAKALVLTDRGQLAMDKARQILIDLSMQRRAVLRQQIDATNGGNLTLVLVDGLALAVVIVLALAVGLGLWRTMTVLRDARVELTRANARLAGMNDVLEETVAKRTADLQEANEEVQRFAYIVSHDLRAPLVNIMGFTGELEAATQALRRFTETLPEGLPDDVRVAAHDDLPEAIHFIKASTGKMDRLIAAILRLSREGQRRLAPEPLDMRALLSGIVDSVRHQARQGDVEVVLEPLPNLTADKLAVEQIFGNLMENALKYTMPGRTGRIVVRGREGSRLTRYEVEDNGRGIAEKDRQRIFELFRRAGDQTVPGEGIGLAHVRALVRRLGGRIDCESTLGAGSIFRVYLPLNAVVTEAAS